MSKTLEIRPIEATDHAEWKRLWTDYLTFYESSVSEEIYATSFARLLSDEAGTYNGHIALLDGAPVGLVHYLFHAHMWHKEQVCYLQDLFADPFARGAGVGRALIQSVYDAADARGVHNVYWTTQEFNTTARRLYDRIGTLTPFIKYQRPG